MHQSPHTILITNHITLLTTHEPDQSITTLMWISNHHLTLKMTSAEVLERFSIAFTANGKRQADISRLPKTREIYLVSAYILPVSHSYGASTKNREIS